MRGKLLPGAGLAGLIVLAALWASSSSTHATTFAPIQPGGVVFSALGFGANPDITVSLDILPPSTNFSNQAGHVVTFGDGDVATEGDLLIPTGAYIGSLTGVWDLGLINGPCGALVPVGFDLVEAATPATTAFVIPPAGPDTNLLANFAADDGDIDDAGPGPVIAAFAGDGIADGANAYPSFIAASLDPDGPGIAPPIAPLARYFGVDFVAGALISIVNLVVMPPGSMAALPNLAWMTPAWGFPMLLFVDSDLGPPSLGPITDSCNLTSSTALLGIAADNFCTPAPGPPACDGFGAGLPLKFAVSGGCPGGPPLPNECGPDTGCPCPRVTNPPAPMVLTWRQYVVSQRDWDTGAGPPVVSALGDGHPNNLDPCPTAVDPFPPPPPPLDSDGDGIWDSCDPFPFVPDPPDVDFDGWLNRLDNCLFVPNPQPPPPVPPALPPANAAQYDQDVPVGVAVADGGPRADAIGPACDPAPGPAAGAMNGHYHATALAYHICIGPAAPDCSAVIDADGDGIVNVSDNCIFGANPPMTFPGPNGADVLTAAEFPPSVVLDVGSTDGFTVGSPVVIGSPLETLRYIVAIDPAPAPITITIDAPITFPHGIGDPVAQVMFSQSQRDMTADGFVDISELALLAGSEAFGTWGGDPGAPAGYQGRLDLNYDNFIDISDFSGILGLFVSPC